MMGAAIGTVMGAVWFYKGFKELQIKRTIQNIPTSKIMTGAVGTDVEIKGKVITEQENMTTAPISGKPCVIYHLEIQEERRRKNSTYWKTIDQFYSSDGFYVDDKSGASAFVKVKGARINRKGKTSDYVISSNNFDEMPDLLNNAVASNQRKLKKFKIKKTSWLLSGKFRFVEWSFAPNEEVYVLGHAESGLRLQKMKKPKMKYFLKAKKAIRTNKKLAARFDANQDGKLDPNEMERGATVLAQRLSDKYEKEQPEELIPPTKLIFKNKKPHSFIISNRSEKELVQNMGTWATVKIWGGPILSVACAWYLYISLANSGFF